MTETQTQQAPISNVTVIGAGTMGHGIAHVAAVAGMPTVLFDVAEEALVQAKGKIEANLRKGIARGKLTEERVAHALEQLSTSSDLSAAVKKADLIIEAAPEKLAIKQQIFSDAADSAPAHAIFASNTSSLSLTALAAATDRPERVIGMHFFNPPHILKLLELVRAEQTDDATVALAKAAGERMERELIIVNDSPGFATSRLGLVLGLEAVRMVEQGVASPEDIDRAMTLGYGHPMGPLRLTDLVGLDVRLAIADYLHAEIGEQFRAPPLLRKLVRAGRLGKKSGHGFYRW